MIFWKGHAKGNSFGLRHIFLDRVIEKIRCMDARTSSVFCIICVYVLLLKLLQTTQTHTHTVTCTENEWKWQIDFRSFQLEYERCTLFYHLILYRVDDFIRNGKIWPWDIVPLQNITNKWWLIGGWVQPWWSSLVSLRIDVVSLIHFVSPASTECKTILPYLEKSLLAEKSSGHEEIDMAKLCMWSQYFCPTPLKN